MSRTFNGNTANYLSVAAAAVASMPLSMTCYWRTEDLAADQVFASLGNNGASGYYAMRFAGNAAGDPLYAFQQSDAGANGNDATWNSGTSAGEWHSLAAVFSSTTSRTIYYGGQTSTGTTDVAAPSPDFTAAGILRRSSVLLPLNGQLSELAIWSVALTASEAAAQRNGVCPQLIRPTALEAYYPCFKSYSTGGEPNWHGSAAFNLAETGTVGNADHPPIVRAYPVP